MFPFSSERLIQAFAERRRVTPRGLGARFHPPDAVLDAKIVVSGSYRWRVPVDAAKHGKLVILRDVAAARSFRDDLERTWQDKEFSRP